MIEKDYYTMNGLSPLEAMKMGLISEDEYRGFLIGNVIKYVCRYQYKGNPITDLEKCRSYVDELINLEKIGDIL